MIAYHGTTRMRARGIFQDGFLPKPPSRRVWFAESRNYAMGRAKTQARRAADVAVVLACKLDLQKLSRQLGERNVVHRKGIIAIDGKVPVDMLLTHPFADLATVPKEVADWVNGLLGLEEDEAVSIRHPGLVRLSRWVNSRLASEPESKLLCSELLEKARRWLPEHFVGADLDEKALKAHRRLGLVDYEVDAPALEPDPREEEAFACLEDQRAEERSRGLRILAEIHDPDLFDWCAMFLDDEAETVQEVALRVIFGCRDGQPEVIVPCAQAAGRRVRAAAIAALARHAGEDAPEWIRRGLRDPEPCVRVEAARFFDQLDPKEDRAVFELAEHDPNPDIAHRAKESLLRKQRQRAAR